MVHTRFHGFAGAISRNSAFLFNFLSRLSRVLWVLVGSHGFPWLPRTKCFVVLLTDSTHASPPAHTSPLYTHYQRVERSHHPCLHHVPVCTLSYCEQQIAIGAQTYSAVFSRILNCAAFSCILNLRKACLEI